MPSGMVSVCPDDRIHAGPQVPPVGVQGGKGIPASTHPLLGSAQKSKTSNGSKHG